jgi:hypothetical protein
MLTKTLVGAEIVVANDVAQRPFAHVTAAIA